MMIKGWLNRAFLIAVASLMGVSILTLEADAQERTLRCGDGSGSYYNKQLVSDCDVKELTLPAQGVLNVDASRNGGISIKGWDRNEVLLRARIQTAAGTAEAARALINQVRIETGATIQAAGPERTESLHWDVSYEIFVPRRSNLSLKTYNGGISIADVRGQIEFEGHNGGVSLKRLGGNVRGRTRNGGISVVLGGSSWEGEGLDVQTTNGGVHLVIPQSYSARLETSTVNGSLNVDLPVSSEGRTGKNISMNLGSGGATIRVVTTNGGISLKRSNSE